MEQRTMEDFEPLEFIGEGSLGAVCHAMEKANGRHVAIKQIRKSTVVKFKQVENIRREKDNLFRLRGSPFIVELFYTFQDQLYLYFVMEYVPGGDLLSFIQKSGPLQEITVRSIAAEVIIAIEILQQHNIAHRDIKPENILLTKENHVRLIDFGSSRQFASATETSRDFVGTANYLPPELLRADGSSGLPGDIWALGCLIYQLVYGQKAFNGNSEYLIFQEIKKILSEPLPLPLLPSGAPSEPLRDLLRNLLSGDPSQRMQISQIKEHPFFHSIPWDKVSQEELSIISNKET